MPVIGAGAGIPGTGVGVSVRIAHQTPREREADTATRISEDALRDRNADTAITPFDRLIATPSPLDRWTAGDRADDPPA